MSDDLRSWVPAGLTEVMAKLPRTEDRLLTGRRVTREDFAAYSARCDAAMAFAVHPLACFCCACLHEATGGR